MLDFGQLHWGVVGALAALIAFLLSRTMQDSKSRLWVCSRAGRFAGFKPNVVIIGATFAPLPLTGMVKFQLVWTASTERLIRYGFTAIIVAFLARLSRPV